MSNADMKKQRKERMARKERVRIANDIIDEQKLQLSFDIYDVRFCSWYEDGREIFKSWVTINAENNSVAIELADIHDLCSKFDKEKYFYKAERFGCNVHFSLTVRDEKDGVAALGTFGADINTISHLMRTLIFAREAEDNGALLRKVSPLRICCDGRCFEKWEKCFAKSAINFMNI